MATALQVKDWLTDFDALVARVDGASPAEARVMVELGRAKLDAAEARRLAGEVGADGDTRQAARTARSGGKRSKASARRAAERARAVSKNERLADDMDSGRLSPEQVDLIAGAMETDESAATDQDLIDRIADTSVDQGRKIVADWKHRKTTKDQAEAEHRRQRRLRSLRRYLNKTKGLDTITFEGDTVTIDEIWNLLQQRERQLHDADGGRDLDWTRHPRTREQRLFDALHDLICGADGAPAARPSAVVVVPVDGDDCAELVGTGPISDTAARTLLERAGLSMMLINELTGEPLWLSRRARHASAAQLLTLVVRDGGCVQCGAPWIRCHTHHLTPWNAPAQGHTDLDNLALLCPSCHTNLHADQLTLIRKPDGTWGTRAALDHELTPNRPQPQHQRAPRQKPPPATTTAPRKRPTPPEHTVRADNHTNPALFDQPATQRGSPDDDAGDG